MNTFEVIHVSKKIKETVILSDINLSLERGGIYGLVGENGSGKTMLIRLLAGLIKPTEGEFKVDGKKVNIFLNRSFSVGIVIENISLYPDMTGRKNLEYLASINKEINNDDIKNALIDVGLDFNDKRKVRKYSLGMKQKLSLAQAFMENPELILLDEPTNALDEQSVLKFHETIRKHADRGAIIIIASHNKDDIESLCNIIYTVKNKRVEVIV